MLLLLNGGGFSGESCKKYKTANTKPQPAEWLAPALFTPTTLLETDVLSDPRVSDEASTLTSDLCIQ